MLTVAVLAVAGIAALAARGGASRA